MNDPENPERPEHPEGTEHPEGAEGPEDPARTEDPENSERRESAEHAEGAGPAEGPGAEGRTTQNDPTGDAPPDAAQPESEVTSVYVRRGRTPTLGFWVALAVIVPAVAALLVSPLFQFADIGSVLNFMLMAAVFVGLPLAAIACVVDAFRHRTPKHRRR